MKGLIAGNWKLHGGRTAVAKLLKGIVQGSGEVGDVELAVFPPYVYLEQCERELGKTAVAYGAQNVCNEQKGAFTGEVSAEMLAEFGCRYVIVGHSERRHIYGESNELVAAKYAAAQAAKLQPILCVGETLKDREAGDTLKIVEQQLGAILALENGVDSLYNAVVAYEPVWAIGTGKTASPEQAQEVHAALRSQVAKYDEALAKELRILYGGSVKRDNAEALFAMPDINGGLIGGASLDSEHFLDIARLCNSSF